ncbi:PAAR domain-containing protein [Gilliamella sp. Bif1-4]|uniref:PAAR domain-containing protein n=1 Tax=Gilliamella sp. Bif1-4 TaxID=3120233 RepID=UPI00080DD710|nr:PAAR domain-containing protein [Gilliamella apicola]OCG42612.1 hypothetical protein A9G25_00995 [Gilliamella apicola]
MIFVYTIEATFVHFFGEDHYAYCPKCESTGKIIEGADNFIVAGKTAAYDGCIIACKCSPVGYNKIIATKSTIFVGVKNDIHNM